MIAERDRKGIYWPLIELSEKENINLLTLQQIADRYGVSREWVRQVLNKAGLHKERVVKLPRICEWCGQPATELTTGRRRCSLHKGLRIYRVNGQYYPCKRCRNPKLYPDDFRLVYNTTNRPVEYWRYGGICRDCDSKQTLAARARAILDPVERERRNALQRANAKRYHWRHREARSAGTRGLR